MATEIERRSTESSSELAHTTERPEDWGWHAEFPKLAQLGGWVSVIILLLMMTATHYNQQGTLFLGLVAGVLVVGIFWDRRRRKNAWRK